MAIISNANYFLTLSVLAVILLWGISLWNGTVKELLISAWSGSLADGTPLKNHYTGIFVLDYPLTVLVGFFFYGTNNTDRGYQHFLIDAYSTLQAAFVWLYVESERSTPKPFGVRYPIIWGLLWQCFGAAISLPLFYWTHLKWLQTRSFRYAPVSLSSAMALPISFTLGGLIPAVIGMWPTWYPRSTTAHQNILAFWQPDPIWVAMFQVAATSLFRQWPDSSSPRDLGKASRWVKMSYAMAAASSAFGHIYVMATISFSGDPSLRFMRMYLPHLFSGPQGTGHNVLIKGPWLFLQYDLIIISVSSLSWAYLLVSKMDSDTGMRDTWIMPLIVLGTLTVGPGATVSLVLYWRETRLFTGSSTASETNAQLAKKISS